MDHSYANIITQDAFSSDHSERLAPLGAAVTSRTIDLRDPAAFSQELPMVKSNVMAYITADGLANTSRNMLTVSPSYTAYVVKKNLIRIIHTITTEKCLLRGHMSSIADMKFARNNSNRLCSVDSGINDDVSHIFVWEVVSDTGDNELQYSLECEFGLPAQLVCPHPSNHYVWAIAHKNCMGVFTTRYGDRKIKSYSELSINFCAGDDSNPFIDISFSRDCKTLLGTTAAGTYVMSLPGGIDIDGNAIGPSSVVHIPKGSLGMIYSAVSINEYRNLLIVSADSGTSGDCVVSVFASPSGEHNASLFSERPIQQIKIPFSGDSIVYGCYPISLCADTFFADPGQYPVQHLLVSSKNSRNVAILAVDCERDMRVVNSVPICHVSLLDFSLPTLFVGATVVENQDHHSDAMAEQLEICCYQEGAKPAVQQYHIPVLKLRSWPLPGAIAIEADSSVGAAGPASGRSILSWLVGGSAEPAPAPPSPAVHIPGLTEDNNVAGRSILSMLKKEAPPTPAPAPAPAVPVAAVHAMMSPSTLLAAAMATSPAPAPTSAPVPASAAVGSDLSGVFDRISQQSAPQPKSKESVNLQETAAAKPVSAAKGTPKQSAAPSFEEAAADSVSISADSALLKVLDELALIKAGLLKDAKGTVTKAHLDDFAKGFKKDMMQLIEEDVSKKIVEKVSAEMILLTGKVREGVKESVKASLSTSFRAAFENSLLPAFQAGTDRMFAQVQETFEIGIDGLVEQGRMTQQMSNSSTAELQNEVRGLRAAVASLEAKLDALASRVSLTQVQAAGAAASPVKLLVDPLDYLREPRDIPMALEAALEFKDVDVLLGVLNKLSPTEVSTTCGAILTLCASQQLAYDLSTVCPSGSLLARLDWVKSLIMGMLYAVNPSDEMRFPPFLGLLKDILLNLGSAARRVNETLDVPAEAKRQMQVDIKMLITIIESHIRACGM